MSTFTAEARVRVSSSRLAALNRSGCGYVPYYRTTRQSHIQPVVVRGACEHVSFHLCLRARSLAIGIDSALRTGCWAGWRSKRASPLVRVHVASNGSIHRRVNLRAPKSTTHLANGSARMRSFHATLLERASSDALDAERRAVDAWAVWHGT